MTQHPILIAGPLRRKYRQYLEDHYDVTYLKDMVDETATKIVAAISVSGHDFDDALFERLPNLQAITNYGVGYDNVNIDLATRRGVKVSNTPDVLTDDTADLSAILMLSLLRGVVKNDAYVRDNKWEAREKLGLDVSPHGLKLGILGLGRIGREIAKRAEAFGMEVCYHSRTKKEDVSYPFFDSLMGMARHVDVLSLACVGGKSTYHIVNQDVLKALGPSGYIVNIARGTVIDEAALVKALEEKTIAGAALDVFEDEPHVPEALKKMDNVIVQPHRGSATERTRDAMAGLVYKNLESWFSDKKLVTPVN